MKAIQLNGYEGLASLAVVDVDRPKPGPHEVLIEVKAAGINFAEIELTAGRYRLPKQPPFIMGFEAAGIVREVGSAVTSVRQGDRVASIMSSGGYAEYAIANAGMAIPIPAQISFAEASTIPIQGISAYALLRRTARPKTGESILIQAAAGGVGLYLVQLAKIFGLRPVIALAGTKEKVDLVTSVGADTAINYTDQDWADQVKKATHGRGVDIVLESVSGAVGEQSFKLLAPFGRIILYGARNVHDSFGPERIQQLILQNQSAAGFNLPSLRPEQIAACVPDLLDLITRGKIKLFANHSFSLTDVKTAYWAFSNRKTIGKVVLVP
jgi:NADPH2:quinone reductase